MGKYARERMPSPSDVTDEEWVILEPLLPGAKPDGRPQEMERREILNAMVYVLRSGYPWRLLPHDVPRWLTASWDVRQGKRAGIWEQCSWAIIFADAVNYPAAKRAIFLLSLWPSFANHAESLASRQKRSDLDARDSAWYPFRGQGAFLSENV